jgi:hypothetical protein
MAKIKVSKNLNKLLNQIAEAGSDCQYIEEHFGCDFIIYDGNDIDQDYCFEQGVEFADRAGRRKDIFRVTCDACIVYMIGTESDIEEVMQEIISEIKKENKK